MSVVLHTQGLSENVNTTEADSKFQDLRDHSEKQEVTKIKFRHAFKAKNSNR